MLLVLLKPSDVVWTAMDLTQDGKGHVQSGGDWRRLQAWSRADSHWAFGVNVDLTLTLQPVTVHSPLSHPQHILIAFPSLLACPM